MPTNWSQTAVPGAMDTAVIPGGTSCVPNIGPDQTVAGLTVEGTLGLGTGSGSAKLSVTTASVTGFLNLGANGELDVLSEATIYGMLCDGRLDNAGDVNFSGSGVTCGAGTNLTGAGLFNVNGIVTIASNVSVNAPLDINAASSTAAGSLIGGGSIDDYGDVGWYGGTIGLTGGVTLEATSEFKTLGSYIKYLTAGTITNLSESTNLEGTGALDISMGASFDAAFGQVDVSLPLIGPTTIRAPIGTFIVGAGCTLDAQPNSFGGTSITCSFTNNGIISVDAANTLTLTPGATATIALDGKELLTGNLLLQGAIASPTGFTELSGGGTMQIGNSSSTGSSLTIGSGAGAIIQGNVEVASTCSLVGGTVYNSGKLIMDVGSSNGAGLGAYVQANDGTLDLQAMGPGKYSKLKVLGNAQLSGTLELDFKNGYVPTHGTAFLLLTAGSVSAHFDATPPGMTTTYTSTTVTSTEN